MIDNPKLGVVLSIEYIYNYCLGGNIETRIGL